MSIRKKQKNFKISIDKASGMCYNIKRYGGIAQLARAIGSYPIGRGFKSNFRYQARWSSG